MKNNCQIFEEYVKYANDHRLFVQNGDHRNANKIYKKLSRLYKYFVEDRLLAEEILIKLMRYSDPNVQIWAATHSLGLLIDIENAEKILINISRDFPNDLIGLSAEMTLREWKTKGKLNF